MAPGEASGAIRAGDRLVRVQGVDIQSWSFGRVVEELRGIPSGDVALRFYRSPLPSSAVDASIADADPEPVHATSRKSRWSSFFERASTSRDREPSTDTALVEELEERLRRLELELEREKKCRFLAERKNVLYRNALRALGDENAQLRYRVLREEQHSAALERAHDALELRI
ncbi:hypothetical protein PINS_up006175 [Pythium insidiosum]|nr:hypothetical protein PINS_up006175 [Pythium insidiosum]